MKKLIPIFLVLSVFTGCGFTNSDKPLSVAGDKALDQKFYDQALQSNDLSLCNQILDKTIKDECTLIATAGKLTAEAVAKADVTLCKKIELERFRTACETQVKPLVEAKQADAERLKIEQQAIDQQDAKLCDQIKIEGQRTSCKYNILANQAIQKKDPSLCNAIGEKTGIERCKQNIQ
ncbi:MAG: hypothetical protein WC651_04625 [Candidatus Gracilibacteria bacterium]|jgi:hypothetical protein